MTPEDWARKLAGLKPGDHLCFLYDTEDERLVVVTSFLAQGLANGEKIFYLTDLTPPTDIIVHLKKNQVRLEPYLAAGQMNIVEIADFFGQRGLSDSENIMAWLRAQVQRARTQGCAALRLTAEMSWAGRGRWSAACLGELEARLTEFCQQQGCLLLCQYDRRYFGASLLLEILNTHPKVIVGRELMENIYYLPTREFLGEDLDTARLSHLLANLKEHKQAVEALKEQTHELGERLKELNCLYDVARMVASPGASLQEVLATIVKRIPPACQYPDLAAARLTLNGQDYQSASFQDLPWKFSSEIMVYGDRRGELTIGYLKEPPPDSARPFFARERKLVEAIAKLTGRFAERLWTEEARRQSEEKYRTLVEKIPLITYIAALDKSSSTLYVSPQIKDMLGFTATDFQADPEIWKNQLHPADRERVLAEVARCHDTGETFVSEYRLLSKEGIVKWFRDEAWLLRDHQGQPLCLQGIMVDITERRQAEEKLRRYQQQLERLVEERTSELRKAISKLHEEIAERYAVEAALERSAEKIKLFAYSIIHDLKNPAIGIQGLTNLLKKQYGKLLDDRGKKYCEQILQAAEQIANLVKRINAYIITKEVPLNLKTIRLMDILQIIREEFAGELARRRLKWCEPPNPPEFRADGLYVLRALRNLVDNALKYGGDKLTTISIGCQESEDAVILSVQDDGVGIHLENPQEIFGIFKRYETSIRQEGAGLGLAIVKEIAERHGGTVWVESKPDQGTTIYLSFTKDLEA